MNIKIPILNNEYFVIVTNCDKEDVKNTIKRYGHEHKVQDMGGFRGRTFMTTHRMPVIWINGELSAVEAIGTLSHESVSAVS